MYYLTIKGENTTWINRIQSKMDLEAGRPDLVFSHFYCIVGWKMLKKTSRGTVNTPWCVCCFPAQDGAPILAEWLFNALQGMEITWEKHALYFNADILIEEKLKIQNSWR